MTITVDAVNDAPAATNDGYATGEDTPLTVTAPGVLGNDSDIDGQALTATKVGDPSHGTVTVASNGGFTYTPVANYNGLDSFTYKANDGSADSGLAIVTIGVAAANDAPTATNDNHATGEDTPLAVSAPGILGNDTDVDANPLTATLGTGPSHAAAFSLNPDGSFSYTPDPDFNGQDSFTYKANDGSADSNLATVTITVNAVNDAPTATNDTFSTDEDTPLAINAPGVLDNDTDVDANPLTVTLGTGPIHAAAFTLDPDGSFTYTPDADFNGQDSFTYTASDGQGGTDEATVTIAVVAVNDNPTATTDNYNTNEDTTLTVNAPGVLRNDTDVDGDSLALPAVGLGNDARADVRSLTVTPGSVTPPAHGTLVLNGDGSFEYTPNPNYNGADSFTYRATDGIVDSADATVTIIVGAVNDAPVSANDAYTTAEDTPLTAAAPSVLANDTDPDGGPLTAAVVSAPTHGVLTLSPTGALSYTPTADYNGADSFTYRANDGTVDGNIATVSLTVTPINDAPVAVADTQSTAATGALVSPAPGPLANDIDADGDRLTAVLVSGPVFGVLTLNPDGSYVYTPNPGFVGTDSFTYAATDGTSQSNPVVVTITVNGPQEGVLPATGVGPTTLRLTVAAILLVFIGLVATIAGRRRRGT